MNQKVESTDQTELAAPLSFPQQRLWLLDRLLPTGSVYNIAHVLQLSGELHHAALRDALNEVVRRHEVLRTRIGSQDDEPMQVITPQLEIALHVEELGGSTLSERECEARQRARAEARAAFDLERGPLIRARLLRLTPSEHWLLLTLHHIVTDGWSSGVITRELVALYNAYDQGEASPLPALPVQYADYATWQRQWLQGEVLERQLDYWRHALAEAPVLDLPTDRPRPALASHQGGRVPFEVPEPLTRALKALGLREGATLFMTLLAAFQVLLYRHSGQEDIAVGLPIAGRTRPELEGLIGFFVNTLVLRGDLSGEPSFKTYLAQVRSRALDAYAHQNVPFEKLVEELAPKRDLSRNPLYQASLAFQNTPPGYWKLRGLEVRRLDGISGESAKFDLSMNLAESAGRLSGYLEYATDLFDAATIERMMGHWRVLLEGVVADPQQPISRLPLLTREERVQLLVEWNATAADYPRDQCIQQLFEQQVERTPDSLAVVFEEQQLTYRELNARANQLAHHLRTLGVGPEVPVGLCLKRSPDLVVGLLGILKAGGVYAPLDPSYPAQRLAIILDSTQAPVLLTHERLLGQLPPQAQHTLCLDRDWSTVAAQPPTNPPATATATNLAYVVYTSGSTGTPKGVMIEHRSVVNHLFWMQQRFSAGGWDCVLQTAPIGFDQSIWQLLFPLTSGGRVVLPAPEAHRSADEIVAAIERHRVTILRIVPTMLVTIQRGTGFRHCPSLRLVILAGETLARDVAADFLESCGAELVNAYGPTETTFVSTVWTCGRTAKLRSIPVGRPLGNTRIYLLDRYDQPVPVGVAGELCIGGDGVARGYWKLPELTAERFVADPFAQHPGARMYRTGDRARYLPEGNLEFLGRLDTQVKLRGFRIELGEIEAVLARQPQVHEAAVIVREDVPGEKRLVAYVVARGDAIAAADLRAFAKQLLPDYMLPAAFVLLPALPLMPNGKVDRSALPAPAYQSSEPGHEPPRTPIERALARAMAEVLSLDRVGLNDNFFELGGHSLLAVRLMNRIRHDLNIDLSLRQLFATPTVSGLALAALDNMVPGATDRLLSPRA